MDTIFCESIQPILLSGMADTRNVPAKIEYAQPFGLESFHQKKNYMYTIMMSN
jgi:hypothetical protein